MLAQSEDMFHAARIVLLLILLCLLALSVAYKSRTAGRGARYAEEAETGMSVADLLAAPLVLAGGEKRRRKKSANVVVDTLNLVHWLRRDAPKKAVDLCDIIAAIDKTAPAVRSHFPGRVVYVTKDKETQTDDDRRRARALYQAAARRNGVYIHVVEQLPGPRRKTAKASHAGRGRDDFYIITVARKLGSPVLSRDKYRDIEALKSDVERFRVFSYSPVKRLPEYDYVNPAAAEFRRMGRPAVIDYTDAGL